MAVLMFPKPQEIHQESPQDGPRKASVHPVDSFLGRLGPASRRGFQIALDNIAEIVSNGTKDCYRLDWASLTYQDTARAREGLAAQFATRTANYGLCALRGVLKECWRLGLMSHEEFRRATDVAAVRGDNTAAGRVLTVDELISLFGVCVQDKSPKGMRDLAMLAVLYSTGLRRSELLALNVADYNDGTLTVRGKGNRIRLAYVVGEAREMLEAWLGRPDRDGKAIVVAINKSGKITENRLDGRSLAEILRRRAQEADIKPFSPHDLRRTTATHLLDKGIDIGVVQQMLGHKFVATTLLYDRRGETAKEKAAKVLAMPNPVV
jgi:site-specific recombinase XerD